MTETNLLKIIDVAFREMAKPIKLTSEDDDFECVEHDHLLHSLRKGHIELSAVHNPGNNLFSNITPEELVYFFEDFAKLSLLPPDENGEWFGDQFLISLNCEFKKKCTSIQQAVVRIFLIFIQNKFSARIKNDLSVYKANTFDLWNV